MEIDFASVKIGDLVRMKSQYMHKYNINSLAKNRLFLVIKKSDAAKIASGGIPGFLSLIVLCGEYSSYKKGDIFSLYESMVPVFFDCYEVVG